MNIIELQDIENNSGDSKLNKAYSQFSQLLIVLKKTELPDKIMISINRDIEEINSNSLTEKKLSKFIKQKQSKIIKELEKNLKIVPKSYYRNLWLAIGMSAFGLPIGAAIGLTSGNIGLLAIGLPIGMAIGTAVGSSMDKKALEEGRQLDIEVN